MSLITQPQALDGTSAVLPSLTPRSKRALDLLGRVWKRIISNPKVALGFAIVIAFLLVAIFGPIFAPYDPQGISNLKHTAPNLQHLLGTTTLGQDVFSQFLYGTRSSVFWGFATGLLVMIISTVAGLTSGYFGGVIDDVITWFANITLVIPALPLAIVVVSFFPRGPLTIALVIALTNWAWNSRILRAQTMSLRSRDFVTAARASGESSSRIIFFEILPNVSGIVAAAFVSTTIFVILAWAALEFLGLGDINSVSWGSMLYWAQASDSIFSGLWWWFVPPGVAIAVLGAGLTLINFGVDEIADPRLRKQPKIRLLKHTQKAVA